MNPKLWLLLSTMAFVLLVSCNPECPDRRGNYIQLRGEDFDSLYNEIVFLPANVTEEGDPRYYDRERVVCEWCLPVDIAEQQTMFVLRGDTRTDTITLTYDVELLYSEGACGYQARVSNLGAASTFTNHDLRVIHSELSIWELWVEL